MTSRLIQLKQPIPFFNLSPNQVAILDFGILGFWTFWTFWAFWGVFKKTWHSITHTRNQTKMVYLFRDGSHVRVFLVPFSKFSRASHTFKSASQSSTECTHTWQPAKYSQSTGDFVANAKLQHVPKVHSD